MLCSIYLYFSLVAGCRDLLQRFLTADPDRRITLQQAMHHPWLADSECIVMFASSDSLEVPSSYLPIELCSFKVILE
jgi:serine/threonine protein kinase